MPTRRTWNRRRVLGWAALGVGLVASFILGAVRDYQYGGDVIWVHDYATGLRLAREKQLPIVLSFHSSDCDGCRKMDSETFMDTDVVEATHRYVCIRVNANAEPELIAKYGVTELPVVVAADSHGGELDRLRGYTTARAAASFLREQAERYSAGGHD